MNGGAPQPTLWASEHDLFVAYLVGPDAEKTAVLRFASRCHKFGYPNEEVLNGHPLYEFGLQFYGFHVVENSPWIADLCRQNRVHPCHAEWLFADLQHWIIAFHDTTLEVVGKQASVIAIYDFDDPDAALRKARSQPTNAA
jgi:hypothetical protein